MSTGVGCHFLLQGIFPTQGLNPGLPHCRQMLYHLSHQGVSSKTQKWYQQQIAHAHTFKMESHFKKLTWGYKDVTLNTLWYPTLKIQMKWGNLNHVCEYVCVCVCVCVCVLSRFSYVWFFGTLWTVAHQTPLSMGFSGQEYWSGLPYPLPMDLPNPGTEFMSPASPELAGGFFTHWTTWKALSE